jgi:hypothetical protein
MLDRIDDGKIFDITLLDCVVEEDKAWREVSSGTISNCFKMFECGKIKDFEKIVERTFLDFTPLRLTEMNMDEMAVNASTIVIMNSLTVNLKIRSMCSKRCTTSSTLQVNTRTNKITVYNTHAVLSSLTT